MADEQKVYEDNDLVFKKWHKTGFISFKVWGGGQKVKIEIGAMSPDKKLISVSPCWVNTYDFLTFLHSDIYRQVDDVYPDFRTKGFVVYGGSAKDGQVVSRVFKIEDWNYDSKNPNYTRSLNRRFKCGEFEGKRTSQGAITPVWDKKLSMNFTMMKAVDIVKLYHAVLVRQQAFETAVASGATTIAPKASDIENDPYEALEQEV